MKNAIELHALEEESLSKATNLLQNTWDTVQDSMQNQFLFLFF